jgi:hypothetical protein
VWRRPDRDTVRHRHCAITGPPHGDATAVAAIDNLCDFHLKRERISNTPAAGRVELRLGLGVREQLIGKFKDELAFGDLVPPLARDTIDAVVGARQLAVYRTRCISVIT